MIRYDTSKATLQTNVNKLKPKWMTSAAQRTAAFVKAGKFAEKSSIWSQIKPVFIQAQSNKCIFCERQFEDPEHGTIEYDVEHFRPKSSVKAWEPSHSKKPYSFSTGKEWETGYYWLAYDLENYAASCKNCNTPLKSNYFPIAGTRAKKLSKTKALKNEKAFLCYPIGDTDDNPETLVTFQITTAVPAAKNGHKRRRGQVIIDFFELNEREQLHRERARMILLLGNALEKISAGTDNPNDQKIVDAIVGGGLPHTACSRAFRTLWKEKQSVAERALESCKGYVAGIIGIPKL